MYLSRLELVEILLAYGFEYFQNENHYQVEPDVWVYIFESDNKKYILISADFLDYDFDIFPHLLRFNNGEFVKIDFVLQKEIPIKNNSLREKAIGTILFEYTE